MNKDIIGNISVKSAQFETSAATFSQVKQNTLLIPQVAFVGRSNVGKSSLINMLCNQKKLCVTSSTPGRTRLINFFHITLIDMSYQHELYFVDLPGYGFAAASKGTKNGWGDNITDYLVKANALCHVFVLLDIRIKPSNDDIMMLHFLQSNQIPFSLIATKCDKVSRTQVSNSLTALVNLLGVGRSDIIVTSSDSKTGRQEVLGKIVKVLTGK